MIVYFSFHSVATNITAPGGRFNLFLQETNNVLGVWLLQAAMPLCSQVGGEGLLLPALLLAGWGGSCRGKPLCSAGCWLLLVLLVASSSSSAS